MFEDRTYDNIMSELLEAVPNDVDKREGSIIFDALSPIALELVNMYIGVEVLLKEAFAMTASRDYLILRAAERGLEPLPATKAQVKAVISGEPESGNRFSGGGNTYRLIQKLSDNEYLLECEQGGAEGSSYFGALLPLDKEVESARLTEAVIYGEDEEDTEVFRERYFSSITDKGFCGNSADYKAKVGAIEGVGQVKCERTPQGGGTVGIVITTSENTVPSVELLDRVKNYLDPVAYEGLGEGLAPIGHLVRVNGVTGLSVNAAIDWSLIQGADEAAVSAKAAEQIRAYISEVNSQWAERESLSINAYQIIARLAQISEIANVSSVTLNGEQSLTAGKNEIFEYNSLVLEAKDENY